MGKKKSNDPFLFPYKQAKLPNKAVKINQTNAQKPRKEKSKEKYVRKGRPR